MLHSTTLFTCYIFDDYWTGSVSYFWGFDPPISPLTYSLDQPADARYQMLGHPAPGALTFMIYQETHTATMICGSKCYILLLRRLLRYLYVLTIARLGLF